MIFHFVQVMCMWNVTVPGSRPRPSFQWENLTLKLGLTKWHLAGLSQLFKNSPSLKTLSIHIYPGYHDTFQVPDSPFPFCGLLQSTAPHLRGTGKYWNIVEDSDSPQYSAVQLQELAEKLGSLPRASRKAIIYFC